MAVLTTDLRLESVAASLTDSVTLPYRMTAKWVANVLATGEEKEVQVSVDLAVTDPLVQADWDSLFAAGAAAMATVAGGSASAVNPVTI